MLPGGGSLSDYILHFKGHQSAKGRPGEGWGSGEISREFSPGLGSEGSAGPGALTGGTHLCRPGWTLVEAYQRRQRGHCSLGLDFLAFWA